MFNRHLLILCLSTTLIFSCSHGKGVTLEKSISSGNTIQPSEYQLLQPDLDLSKFAQTHKLIKIQIGRKLYPFIVDTGDSNGTLKISQQAAKEMGAIVSGNTSKSKTFYGNSQESEVLVPQVTIGNVEFKDLPCKVMDDSYFWPWNIQTKDIGIIGWKLLNQFNLLFDYKANKLTFYDPAFTPDEILEWKNLELSSTKDILYLNAKIGESKKTYNLIIDSGAGIFTRSETKTPIYLDILFPREYKRLSKDINVIENKKLGTYLGTSITNNQNTLENIYFAKARVPWFLKIKYSGILGWNFFRQYALFFDNKNNILYYKSNSLHTYAASE